jgi:hypothetical protein
VDQGAVARMPPDVHEQFAATEGARGFECTCSRHADRRAPLQRMCLSSTLAATSGAGRRHARTRTPGTAPGSGCSPTSPASRRRPSVYSTPRRRWPCTARHGPFSRADLFMALKSESMAVLACMS